LSPGEEIAMANLRREAAARGIAAQRLLFAEHVPLPEHLARHAHADLFLDTTPHSAGTTANDALLMGVRCSPARARQWRAGPREASSTQSDCRISSPRASPNTSRARLRSRAIRSTSRRLRERLIAESQTKPLFDMARFTRNLEAAIESIAG
jgi:predicted O-linked N-acetylglucosamine transferase (SPINDLY family)